MKLSVVIELAPPTPGCFPARMQWAEYLHQAQTTNRAESRPFKDKRFQPEFNFCADCTTEHRRAMQYAGRCNPDALRSLPASSAQGVK